MTATGTTGTTGTTGVDIADILGDFLYPIVKSFDNTGSDLDIFNKHVQFTADGNNFASSEATMLFAGPPVLRPGGALNGGKLANSSGTITDFSSYLEPIGAAQQYSLQQGGTIVPFSELGSRLKRHARGTGMYSAQLAAVHTKHSDLKWKLYAWLEKLLKAYDKGTTDLSLGLVPGYKDNGYKKSASKGFLRQFIGLESELFNIPFGLLCVTGSAGGKVVHIEYLEDCIIQGSGVGLTAGNPMVIPSISIQVNRPVAFINKSGSSLLSGNDLNKLQNMKKTLNYTVQPGLNTTGLKTTGG